MKIVLSLSCFLLVVTFSASFSNAQTQTVSSHSTPISLTPRQSGALQNRRSGDSTPNSISPEMRRWESLLSQSYPGRFGGKRTAGELMRELRQLGLPIILHESAMLDGLSRDEFIELKLMGAPLHTRLHHALEEFNSCLTFDDGRILVISLDDADSPEFHFTITHDISGMGVTPLQMLDTIQSTVFVDSWEDTGTGLGTLRYIPVRGKDLLVIGQTYAAHLAIRKLLNDINRLTGNRAVPNHRRGYRPYSAPIASSSGTHAVQVPGRNMFPQSSSRRTRTQTGTRGIGPQGGGVFSIKD